jgi:polar amino acid transport system substrate-binding protein
MPTKTPGKLTIATDNPAFPPWFGGEPAAGSEWQVSDPASGEGLESATAYAIAEHLGFTKENVVWVAAPFTTVIQPGPKDFDIDLNQVSYSPERAQAVDLSDGYFENNQAVIAFADTPIANAKSVADLKQYKLGAQVATTSLGYIQETIKPATEAAVYNDNTAALAALNAKQIDGLVVDLGTAFYMTAAELENGVIVGTLPTVGEGEHFSVLLTKGSPLTACINQAIAALKADGTLEQLRQDWIVSQGNAPALEP